MKMAGGETCVCAEEGKAFRGSVRARVRGRGRAQIVDHQHGRGACELILCLRYRAATGISDSPGLCVRMEDIPAYPPLCLRGCMGWRGQRGMYQFLKQLILSMRVVVFEKTN